MTKRVFIVHGWGGSPEEGMHVWLARELKKQGYEVHAPLMPHTETPIIEEWIPYLAKQIGALDSETILIGHSIGCQAIIRYLETQEGRAKGVYLIAPWVTLTGIETEEEGEIARPWLETKINWPKVKKSSTYFFCLFSDNDPFVPLADVPVFKNKLGAETLIEHDKGHYTGETNIVTNPTILNKILEHA